jgi:Leucine-rich repeat (LRR) protein
MQMPDAVYHLMRDTPLLQCSLATNVIAKIPPKFFISFNLLTELDLSNNRISTLPAEMTSCSQLEVINIASNSFVSLPPVLLDIPTLAKIDAKKNFIADVEVEAIVSCSNIEQLNLEENPVKVTVWDRLSQVTSLRVILSPRQQQEWEDLSI